MFDRLNTGGVVATPMEIRNAVFPGKFNAMLHSLSTNPDFLRLWDIPTSLPARNSNSIYNRMYDLEMVLRFFAVPEYKGGLKFKDYLGDYMTGRNIAYAKNPELEATDRAKFESACANAWRVFGDRAFKRPLPNGKRSLFKSAPLADAVMHAMSELTPNQIDSVTPERIEQLFDSKLNEDPDFLKAATSGTNGIGAVQKRLTVASAIVHNALS